MTSKVLHFPPSWIDSGKTYRSTLTTMFLAVVSCVLPRWTPAQETNEPLLNPPPQIATPDPDLEPNYLNLDWKTMGGTQFWSDELIFRDWRIQKNVLTGHFRLLDGDNVRKAWGSFEACKTQLDSYKKDLQLPPMSGKVVFALHGLTRTRNSMEGLCNFLEKEGYQSINMSYASTRAKVADHAASLARVLANLEGDVQIHFVAHSLGNLVIRHYYGDCERNGTFPDPRIWRVVMLAPPNNGSATAETFKNRAIFKVFWGDSGRQIAEWNDLQTQLAKPTCEFGIIAGDAGGNPLLEGQEDFVVTVEETKLPGAGDFITVPSMHSSIMDHAETQAAVLRFFESGCFRADNIKSPLK